MGADELRVQMSYWGTSGKILICFGCRAYKFEKRRRGLAYRGGGRIEGVRSGGSHLNDLNA
jgi:hypothetical protein